MATPWTRLIGVPLALVAIPSTVAAGGRSTVTDDTTVEETSGPTNPSGAGSWNTVAVVGGARDQPASIFHFDRAGALVDELELPGDPVMPTGVVSGPLWIDRHGMEEVVNLSDGSTRPIPPIPDANTVVPVRSSRAPMLMVGQTNGGGLAVVTEVGSVDLAAAAGATEPWFLTGGLLATPDGTVISISNWRTATASLVSIDGGLIAEFPEAVITDLDDGVAVVVDNRPGGPDSSVAPTSVAATTEPSADRERQIRIVDLSGEEQRSLDAPADPIDVSIDAAGVLRVVTSSGTVLATAPGGDELTVVEQLDLLDAIAVRLVDGSDGELVIDTGDSVAVLGADGQVRGELEGVQISRWSDARRSAARCVRVTKGDELALLDVATATLLTDWIEAADAPATASADGCVAVGADPETGRFSTVLRQDRVIRLRADDHVGAIADDGSAIVYSSQRDPGELPTVWLLDLTDPDATAVQLDVPIATGVAFVDA